LKNLKEKDNKKKTKPQQILNENYNVKRKGRPKKFRKTNSTEVNIEEKENIIEPIQDEIQAWIDESILIKEVEEEEDENIETEYEKFCSKKIVKRIRKHSRRWEEWKISTNEDYHFESENICQNENITKSKRKREVFEDQEFQEDEKL
jgi:hypothetical protein